MRNWLGILAIGAALLGGGSVARADDPVFNLTIQNHKFSPEVLEVPAGVKIKLLVKNLDATPEEFESNELHREKVVPAGQEVPIFIGPLEAGTYPFFGDFNPKTAQGKIVAK
ncbi:MAG TPA: cupredoxin domain-containing protein [Stellaceae bacterium]|nr:cupredoxin domain-containing protein [Stellaceae bacterium]